MRPVYALAEFSVAPDPAGEDLPVQRCVQVRDQTAFREIVEQLGSQIYSVCYALLGSAPEADQAAQKVFVRLYHAARPLARQQDVIVGAYRVAIEQSLSELRLRRLRKLLSSFTGAPAAREGTVAIDESRERTLALRYLAVLPSRLRVLLVLREVADQPVDTIAKIMKMKPRTVRRRLLSARQKLLKICPAVESHKGAQDVF